MRRPGSPRSPSSSGHPIVTAALKHFFAAERWQQSIDRFPLSGYALVDTVNALAPAVVVDVGCGFNPFKGRIPNLVGIDFANRHADIVCDIADAPFAAGTIDVALALGSINFGDTVRIIRQLNTVAGWLRPGGHLFMRANPGEPIGAAVALFAWNPDLAVTLGRAAGLAIDGPVQEEQLVLSTQVPARRLFWRYRKPGSADAA